VKPTMRWQVLLMGAIASIPFWALIALVVWVVSKVL
jgi:hypothetical protein